MRTATRTGAAALVALALLAPACGDDDEGSTTGPDATAATDGTGPAGTSPSGGDGVDPTAVADELSATVEAKMAELAVPGAIVLVRNANGEYLQAFGSRTVDGDDPMTVDDHVRIGSNTKTMTGTIVLQLVDEGLLSVDDPVSMYRPDVPNGDDITIGQLLDMRSGLATYSTLESFNQTLDDDPAKAWDPEELVALGLGQPPVAAPGETWFYSNTNTVLLGLIAEQLTGQPLHELFQERIVEPLGLEGTLLPERTDASLPEPYARGYMFGTNVSTIETAALPADEQQAALDGTLLPADHTDDNPSWGWAAGGAISTASDLATYVEALVGGGLLSEELQAERLASIAPTADDPAAPGYGWALATFGPLVGHDGSLPGYQSVMGHDPETGTTVIVLTNLQNSPDGLGTANEITKALGPILFR